MQISTTRAPQVENTLGAVRNTVVHLLTASELEDKRYILVMDRYYSSITLSDYLLHVLRIGVEGTYLTNRKYFPTTLKVKKSSLNMDRAKF